MKTRLASALGLIAISIIGCNKELLEQDSQTVSAVHQNKSVHTIPVEQAVSNLNSLLQSIDKSTKTTNVRAIKSIETVSVSNMGTKAANMPADCDKMLYVVNFEKDEGYAVLAADDRIDSDVLVLTDSGNKSASDYAERPVFVRKIYKNFPLTGDGILIDENGEMYMNPNTFQLYDAEEDDYRIGDFDDSELEVEDYVTIADTLDASDSRTAKKADFMDEAVTNYAKASIFKYESDKFKDTIDDGDGGRNGDGNNNGNDGNRTDIPDIDICVTEVSLSDSVCVEPLVQATKGWLQGPPYNDECPERGIGKNRKKAAVGCVPLAVAKIMVYTNKTFDIELNKDNQFVLQGNARNLTDTQKAVLCRYVGKECGSWYFSVGTFTFPRLSKGFMNKIGFKELDYVKYSTTEVIEHLDRRCPVLIFAYPKSKDDEAISGLGHAHGWVLDGYISRTKTVEKTYYTNDVLTKVVKNTSHNYLIHCDFGWGGYSNGYFASGIFNLYDTSENTIFDTSAEENKKNINYNKFLKIITYDGLE